MTDSAGLVAIDYVIIALYLGTTIGIGWYNGRHQKSAQAYFIGTGNMNSGLIGVSLFATLLSTISYLSIPGEMIGKGPFTLASILAQPINFLIVGYGLIPAYMRQRVTSAYELLELRLGLFNRLLGAGLFISLRLVWMTLLMFLAARALTVMMGLDPSWIFPIVLVAGLVAVTYTSMGGLTTVVTTDLIQTLLLFGGAILVICHVTWAFGGLSWLPDAWAPHWDAQPLFSFDPSVRVTFFGTILSAACWTVATAGGDQTAVQRFMATRDASSARRAYGANLLVSVTVVLTLSVVGFALMSYYGRYVGLLPDGWSLSSQADHIFPHHIAYQLPPIVSGLVVAAMFAAAMSSVDSGVNSITAVVMTDIIGRLRAKTLRDRGRLRLSKGLAFAIGTFVVFGSGFIGQVPGNITAMTQKTSNLVVTPLFSLFVFALFIPFATPIGATIGVACGVTAAVLIAFSGPIFVPTFNAAADYDPISFQWVAPVGLAITLATGCLASWLLPDTTRQAEVEPAESRQSGDT